MIGRSREGAWIEIPIPTQNTDRNSSRSREGAWIEIPIMDNMYMDTLSLPRGSVD